MNALDDTICAIATGTGGGVGIVRMSGPESEGIVARIVRPWPAAPESHKLYFGRALARDGQFLDDVLACVMRAPRSYTGQDVVEIHAHGGARNLARIVETVVAQGARIASPGEFTRR